MTHAGFVKFPRKIEELIPDLSPEHSKILLFLWLKAAYKPQPFYLNGRKIDIRRGQFCTSSRSLAKQCGSGITRQHIRGFLKRMEALSVLAIEKIFWGLTQPQPSLNPGPNPSANPSKKSEKILITLLDYECYDQEITITNDNANPSSNPRVNPALTQVRPTNKERRKKKDSSNKKTYSQNPCATEVAVSLFSFFLQSLKENIPENPEPPHSSEACHFDELLEKHTPDEIRAVITFGHRHEFWRGHLFSPIALLYDRHRKKTRFASLLATKNREQKQSHEPGDRYGRRQRNPDGTIVKSDWEGAF